MAHNVTITYVNESDNTISDLLVFSQPVLPGVSAALAAWQVIEHIGTGDSHRFRYTVESQLRVVWDDGESVSNAVNSMPGQGWQFTTIGNDYQLVADAHLKILPVQIGVLNAVSDTVTVQLLKDGHVWASLPGVTNDALADFEFVPRIWVGFGQRPVTTPFIDFAVMSDAWTEVDLFGLKSLTIAAQGNAAIGYQFVLRDVVGEGS